MCEGDGGSDLFAASASGGRSNGQEKPEAFPLFENWAGIELAPLETRDELSYLHCPKEFATLPFRPLSRRLKFYGPRGRTDERLQPGVEPRPMLDYDLSIFVHHKKTSIRIFPRKKGGNARIAEPVLLLHVDVDADVRRHGS